MSMLKKLIQGGLVGVMLGIPAFVVFQVPLVKTFFSTLGAANVSVKLPEMLDVRDWVIFIALGAVSAAAGDFFGSTMVVSIAAWAGGLGLLYGSLGAAGIGLILGMIFDVINQKFEDAG